MRASVLLFPVVAFFAISSAALATSEQERKDCADRNNLDHAIVACTRIIDDSTDTAANRAIGYINRGIAYRTKRLTDEAFADYNEAIRLNTKNVDAYFHRGAVYATKRQYDRAIADFHEAIRLNPTYAPAYSALGFMHEAAGRKSEAIAAYRKALLLDPSDKFTTDNLKRLGAAPF